MKKFSRSFVCTLLFVMLSFTIFIGVNQAAVKDFKDVPTTHSNYKAIQYMQELGLIGGYPDGTFRPQDPISRKHVAALLDKALKLPQLTSSQVKFSDVPKTHPYYTSIMKLSEAGIVSGGVDGRFNPDAPITRIQMAKVLDLAFDLHMTKQNAFYDVYLDHWGYVHANALFASGVAKGYQGEFSPNVSVTRAHYAEFLYRAILVRDARPVTDKVTKGKAWDLTNRLTHFIEHTMRKGQMNGQPFNDIKTDLYPYATKDFVDNSLESYYPKACVECYSSALPQLRMEPYVRFQFTQPDTNTLQVQTIEFQNGISTGGFLDYTFKKQDGKWKVATFKYVPVGTKNFQLTVDEAKKVIQEEYKSYNYKDVAIKYVTKTQQIELDPVTDEPYTFDQYVFNAETEYGRYKVHFNSSDGLMQ
ncbi:S-layer homology domain-containing protein [Sporosarcina sp. GW1-11]|uniref:S-layer homology domain-containing protein n=1 Tax=Sporosarcina sp. GW1-11 TaxID=2899126 RepID=UPI00294BF159|nr:S-layer homology domain-containing protein [Sporosarcina sp. GW1-11]MDV6378882.1 S-layer homology domain-containing protein [Sporosarcina sp. GW1-11]